MDPRSEATLVGVHPDLCRVIRAASQAQPFIVIHGLRTLAEEQANVAKGASQTMHSRHLPNEQGFACAVDVAALMQGHVSWNVACYRDIWQEVQVAAASLRVSVEWGGNWKSLRDYGHVQLPWAEYP